MVTENRSHSRRLPTRPSHQSARVTLSLSLSQSFFLSRYTLIQFHWRVQFRKKHLPNDRRRIECALAYSHTYVHTYTPTHRLPVCTLARALVSCWRKGDPLQVLAQQDFAFTSKGAFIFLLCNYSWISNDVTLFLYVRIYKILYINWMERNVICFFVWSCFPFHFNYAFPI